MVNTTYLVTVISGDLSQEQSDTVVQVMAGSIKEMGADVRVGKVSDENARRAIVKAIQETLPATKEQSIQTEPQNGSQGKSDLLLTKLQQAFDLLQEVDGEMSSASSSWDYLQNALAQVDHAIEVFD